MILDVKKICQEEINAAKEKYEKMECDLSDRLAIVSHREKLVAIREENAESEIRSKAEFFVKDKIAQLDKSYTDKETYLKKDFKRIRKRYSLLVFFLFFMASL